MCGRYFIYVLIEDVAEVFEAESRTSREMPPLPRFNVSPGQRVPVVRAGTGGREIVDLWWGLVPAWAEDEAFGYRCVNARAETAHEKPAFREAFKKRRCLLPATGFYEWKTEGAGPKQPFACRRDGGEIYAMAGLWESWRNPETGAAKETCTVITCPANTRLRALHERMPVVLSRVEWGMWLDPRVEGTEALRAVLRPDASTRWSFHPVSRKVNSPKNDEPGLLDEVMDETGGLFG